MFVEITKTKAPGSEAIDIVNAMAGVHALLVAEASAQRDSLLAELRQHGMRIAAHESAAEALNALSQAHSANAPFRLVLLDRRIQGMDGELLGTAIKTDEKYRNCALALLAERPTQDAQLLAQAGFSGLLAKSASSRETLAALAQLCGAIKNNQETPFVTTGNTKETMQSQYDNPLPFAGRRVLVADDNPVNQQVAAKLLEKLGCHADTAENGQSALNQYRAARYDLVMMDCDMPVMDGFQATRHIRELEAGTARTPIVALTAATSEEEREKCLECGMDDFLSKPIRPQLLNETLERWLQAPAAEDQAAAAEHGNDELEEVHAMFGADFAELARLYRNDAVPRIDTLHKANASGDLVMVAKVAHAFSGSSASIGASGLSALCKELEMRAKTGPLGDFAQRMTAIEAEYRRVSNKLESMLT